MDDLLNGDQSRSAIVGDIKKKRADSASKKSRRKYKKLTEEKKTESTIEASSATKLDNAPAQSEGNGGNPASTNNSRNSSVTEQKSTRPKEGL